MSGLCRVLPLGYATGRLAGTEREMARARGASSGSRVGLVAAVTVVLNRDPAGNFGWFLLVG